MWSILVAVVAPRQNHQKSHQCF